MTDHLESATRQYLVQEIERLRRENAEIKASQQIAYDRMLSESEQHLLSRVCDLTGLLREAVNGDPVSLREWRPRARKALELQPCTTHAG